MPTAITYYQLMIQGLTLLFWCPRGHFKFCSQCSILKRSDNLLAHHFSKMHPDVHPDTQPFLKVGERPVEGVENVAKYLDLIVTNTQRPASASASSDNSEAAES